ncbi:MAG: rplA [Candidatus Saccharibacteria bacterium]|nr:rplA [Candidatus Saccharibacteria bacterium]
MAETKTELLKQAKELGVEHLTTKNTMAEMRDAIAAVAPKKHDKEALPAEEHEAKVAKAGKRSEKALKETEEKIEKEERKTHAAEKAEAPKAPVKVVRTKLERAGKKLREVAKLVEKDKMYTLKDALELAIKTSPVKFDATVELHINLGVDPRQADQNVRDNLVLPAGTGKTIRIAVLAEADDAKAAKAAGADIAGTDDLLKDIEKGIINFDTLIATPALMARLGKYARVLGPKGLMPNPKSGTVTPDVVKAVEQAKAGRVEYRVDSTGIVHLGVGKVSFGTDKLATNVAAVFASIKSNKPASLKGNYVKAITMSTTMGPGIKIATNEL